MAAAAAAAPAPAVNPFGKFGFTSKEKESVAVPSDLGALSTEQLHTLVRALAAERDELKKKRSASPVFQAPPSAKRAKPTPSAQSLLPGAAKPRASSRVDVGRIATDRLTVSSRRQVSTPRRWPSG